MFDITKVAGRDVRTVLKTRVTILDNRTGEKTVETVYHLSDVYAADTVSKAVAGFGYSVIASEVDDMAEGVIPWERIFDELKRGKK